MTQLDDGFICNYSASYYLMIMIHLCDVKYRCEIHMIRWSCYLLILFLRVFPEKEKVRKGKECNLVPRFSLLPVERPWLGLVSCLPESGRLQTNDLGEGRISVRFVSTKRRRRDQWKLRIRPCLKGPVFFIVSGLVKKEPRTPNPLTAKA